MHEPQRTQIKLRLPTPIQEWLKQRAHQNQRSQTGEVTWLLSQCKALDDQAKQGAAQ